MPTAPYTASQLETERSAWIALRAALLAEEHALVEGEVEQLDALVAAKESSLRTLAARVRERLDGLTAASLPGDADGMQRWLARSTEPARSAWREIVAIENETREINQRNGGLIEQRLALTRQALNVLQTAGSARGTLYDQHGQNRFAGSGRPLNAA